ncbi:DUF3418 domain-containing protein, partial [Escherichia coli]|nr:DUF3418 domain-containing protein [Escherichia coli]
FTEDLLVADDADAVDESAYPKSWRQGSLRLKLTYQFEPGADADGITVHVPLPVLNQVEDHGFDWLVPGMREELATALVKSLPKNIRRSFVPAPDHARRALALMDAQGRPGEVPFADELGEALFRLTSVRVPAGSWD